MNEPPRRRRASKTAVTLRIEPRVSSQQDAQGGAAGDVVLVVACTHLFAPPRVRPEAEEERLAPVSRASEAVTVTVVVSCVGEPVEVVVVRGGDDELEEGLRAVGGGRQ